MKAALYGFRDVVRKEFRHILRDKTTLIFALVIPLFQLMMFGAAINFDVRHVRAAVVDLSRTQQSQQYVAGLKNTEYLDMVSYLQTPDEAYSAIRRNEVRAAIIIPEDFARKYGTRTPPQVRVMIDGSDSQIAAPAKSALQSAPNLDAPNAVDARVDVLFNPASRTQVYTIPALLCVLLQLVTVSLTSFSLVRERELGTLEQLMVTPVGRLGLILGKIVPYALLAMIELLCVLYLGHLMFAVNIAGSLPLLIVLAIPFVLASLALGLFISTVSQNQAQAMQFTTLTTLPSILLSGYVSPRDTLPGMFYLLSDLLPVTHFIEISRGIVVRGAGFVDLLPSVLGLVAIAVFLITLATTRFKKSLA